MKFCLKIFCGKETLNEQRMHTNIRSISTTFCGRFVTFSTMIIFKMFSDRLKTELTCFCSTHKRADLATVRCWWWWWWSANAAGAALMMPALSKSHGYLIFFMCIATTGCVSVRPCIGYRCWSIHDQIHYYAEQCLPGSILVVRLGIVE